jgi:hypothetical protein
VPRSPNQHHDTLQLARDVPRERVKGLQGEQASQREEQLEQENEERREAFAELARANHGFKKLNSKPKRSGRR